MKHAVRSALGVAAVVLSLCAPVAAGAAVPSGAPVDGIRCEGVEGSLLHIHQHVTILDHGRPVQVPEDIGRPVAARCLYWVHTHSADGIVHIESPSFRTYTLGNLFDIWGQPLTRTGVAGAHVKKGERIVTWVDGRRRPGDPRAIELTQHLDVTVEVGPPYRKPVPFTDWKGN